MIVPRSALLLLCLAGFTDHGAKCFPTEFVDLPYAALSCGVECRGRCFAGHCIPSDNDIDNEDSLRSLVAVTAQPGKIGSSAAPPPPIKAASASMPFSFDAPTGLLESKEQELAYEIQRAEAHEALLQAQNDQLRQRIQQWKETGSHIADRESQVVALLNKSPEKSSTVEKPADRKSQGAALLQHFSSRWTSNPNFMQALRLFFITIGIMTVTLFSWRTGCFIQRLRKGEATWSQGTVQIAGSKNLQSFLAAMGLSQQKVEISDIHLGSLFEGSKQVSVSFRMGDGTEHDTQVLKNPSGAFVRFDDTLELSVSKTDPPCTIFISDQRGDVAHIDIPAKEIVRLATRPQQEYFRTELQLSPGLIRASIRRPYIAMRIRNASAGHSRAMWSQGSAYKPQEPAMRAYGSFAV